MEQLFRLPEILNLNKNETVHFHLPNLTEEELFSEIAGKIIIGKISHDNLETNFRIIYITYKNTEKSLPGHDDGVSKLFCEPKYEEFDAPIYERGLHCDLEYRHDVTLMFDENKDNIYQLFLASEKPVVMSAAYFIHLAMNRILFNI